MYCHYFWDFCLLSDIYSISGLRHLAYMSAVEDDSTKGGLSYSASILMPQPGTNRVFLIMHPHHCFSGLCTALKVTVIVHDTMTLRNLSDSFHKSTGFCLFVCFLLFECSPWRQSFMSGVVNICRTDHRQQAQINIWRLEVSLYKYVGSTAAGSTNHLTDLINH